MAVLGTIGACRTNRGLLWLVMIAVLAFTGHGAAAQTSLSRENQIKAVFLFNFAQFVEWPPGAFSSPQAPIVIGVLGDDPFGLYLDAVVRGERVHDRPLIVERYHRVEDAIACHILFISQSGSGRLSQVFADLKDRSILTVGDSDGFVQLGGMIRFLNEKNHIRLKINLGAAKAADLTLSSKLLRPADVINSGKD